MTRVNPTTADDLMSQVERTLRRVFAQLGALVADAELQARLDPNRVGLRSGTAHFLELGFDGETRGQSTDFRPELPLVSRWQLLSVDRSQRATSRSAARGRIPVTSGAFQV